VIGLDTNVIVRYLVQDDRMQSARATRLIENELTPENPGFVSIVAMVETVWVLERAFGRSEREIAIAVESMLQADVLSIENEDEVFAAMTAVTDGEGTFADALIGALGKRAGCSHTVTFDRRASRLASFKSI
jgi:predicted nucleic-acid-binding protein